MLIVITNYNELLRAPFYSAVALSNRSIYTCQLEPQFVKFSRIYELIDHEGSVGKASTTFDYILNLNKPKQLSPSPEDWIITGEEVHEGEFIILKGNLIIKSGGNLTLINCTLLMNCSYPGEWQIVVESGAVMNILHASKVTGHPHEFLFYVYGQIVMRDSYLSYCGYYTGLPPSLKYPGLEIRTDEGALLENVTITRCCCGICCVSSYNVVISKCTIDDSGYGVACINSSNILISACAITIYCDFGVYLKNATDVVVSECVINHTGVGIRFDVSSYVNVHSCAISDNGNGILCTNSSHVTISQSTISRNGNNVILVETSNITISECIINDSKQPYWGGVACLNSSNLMVSDCTISNNTSFGVICGGVSNVAILRCIINGNYIYGISCAELSNAIISRCIISNNDCGVTCFASSRIVVSNCTIHDNGIGVLYVNASYTTLRNNIFEADGLLLMGYESRFLTSHIVENNTVNGRPLCYIVNTTDSIVVSNAGQVIVVNSADITIQGANLSYTEIGAHIVLSENIRIESCMINNNTVFGVLCDRSSNVNVLKCMIKNTRGSGYAWGYGIMCIESINIQIHYCNIYSNFRHGLICNQGEHIVNATYCWWGSPNGPEYKEEGDPDDPEEVWGNIVYEPWQIEPVDVEPPKARIIEPAENSYLSGLTLIRVDALDNVAVAYVEFYINDTLTHTDYEPPYEYEWDTTDQPDGVYVIKVVVYDVNDNIGYDVITVKLDNTVPVIKYVSHSPYEPVEDQEVSVEAKVADIASGVAKVILLYRVNSGPWTEIEMVHSSNDKWVATIPGQKAGSIVEYYVEAYDEVGNVAKSEITSYEVEPSREKPPQPQPFIEWGTAMLLGGLVIAIMAIIIGVHVLKRKIT